MNNRSVKHILPPLFISISVMTANIWHVLAEWTKDTDTSLFTGIAHYFADYFLYISQIAQGQWGAWLFTYPMFTNESGSPTWIYWIYTLIGKLVPVLNITPFTAYTLSLILFSAVLLSLWWILTGYVFPKHYPTRITAFLFLATASHMSGIGEFWFSPMPALNRLGGVPHQMFQTILLLSAVLLFAKANLRLLPALFIVSLLASTANPIQMLLIVAACAAAAVTVRERRISISFITLAASALLGALITNAEFARQPVLTAAKIWENSQNITVPFWHLFLAVGPIALLIPFGISRFTKNPPLLIRTLGIFGFLSFAVFLSPMPRLLDTSPVRWLSPAAYTIIPLLAASGLSELSSRVSKKIRGLQAATVWNMLIIAYLILTIPALVTQVQARTVPLATDPMLISLNHVEYRILDELLAVHEDTSAGVVLTDPALPYDVLMPVFGKRTFTGHPIHTLYPDVKYRLRGEFFSGMMDETNALSFLTDHDISLVFASAPRAAMLSRYGFLEEIRKNDAVIVYSVTL